MLRIATCFCQNLPCDSWHPLGWAQGMWFELTFSGDPVLELVLAVSGGGRIWKRRSPEEGPWVIGVSTLGKQQSFLFLQEQAVPRRTICSTRSWLLPWILFLTQPIPFSLSYCDTAESPYPETGTWHLDLPSHQKHEPNKPRYKAPNLKYLHSIRNRWSHAVTLRAKHNRE